MQNEIVKYKPAVLLILSKHYQYKSSYQRKYNDPKIVHGGYFLGNVGKMNHFVVFNNFDKNSGCERLVYTF